MQEKLVSYKTAKLAEEKGFKEESSSHWYQPRFDNTYGIYKFGDDHLLDSCRHDDDILCPSQSLLQKWLREIHGIHIEINYWHPTNLYYYNTYRSNVDLLHNITERIKGNRNDTTSSYELALEKGLQEALNLI